MAENQTGPVTEQVPQPDIQAILQEQWNSLVAGFFFTQPQGVDDDDLVRKPSEDKDGEDDTLCSDSDTDIYDSDSDGSCTDDETTLADDNTVSHELGQIHFELDFTEHSLADLELEFAEDLEALAVGLETAFEYFDEEDFETKLQKQEVQLSQSTRSNFKSVLGESKRVKRQKRRKSIRKALEFVVVEMKAEKGQQPEDHLKSWFERIWAAFEMLFTQHAEQHQKNAGSVTKSFYQLWQEV